MVEINNKSYLAIGMASVLLLAFIFSMLFQPLEARDNPTIIEVRTGGGNSTGGAVDSVNAGTGISVNQTTGNVLVSNTGVVKNVAGNGISVNQTTGIVMINNTSPDNTVCANVGSGTVIYKDGECNFKTLVGSSDISITNTSNTIVIDYNGTGGGGVSSLTSANSAISLNASSGNVLITPKWQLLAQNSTIGGNSSSITTLVNQASGTDGGLVCSSSGNLGCAEKLTASSVLQGQSFNRITIGLKRVLSPTGIHTVGVMDSSKNFILNCGTYDASTLTTSLVSHTFTCPSTYTVSGVVYIGISSTLQAGGASVLIGSTTPNQFDTTNSIVSQWTTGAGAWVDASTWDLGSSASNGAWKLERVGTVFIKADFPTTKKHLLVTGELRYNGSSGITVRFNNDTASNYATRTTISGTTSSLVSQLDCNPFNSAVITSGDRVFITMWINNNQSGDRKLAVGDLSTGADTSATTAPVVH